MFDLKLVKFMILGSYEIGGILFVGVVYLFINDCIIDIVVEMVGKKVVVLDFDKV